MHGSSTFLVDAIRVPFLSVYRQMETVPLLKKAINAIGCYHDSWKCQRGTCLHSSLRASIVHLKLVFHFNDLPLCNTTKGVGVLAIVKCMFSVVISFFFLKQNVIWKYYVSLQK